MTSIHEGKTYKCDQCDFTATTKTLIGRHITSSHTKDNGKEIRTRLTCDVCEIKSTSETVLIQHKYLNHEKNIKISKRKKCKFYKK